MSYHVPRMIVNERIIVLGKMGTIRKLMRDTIYCDWFDGVHVEPDGFCAWGERAN